MPLNEVTIRSEIYSEGTGTSKSYFSGLAEQA